MTFTVIGHCPRTGRLGIGIATFSITVGMYCNGVRARTGVTISQAFVHQGNNALVFPGVGLGLWVGHVRRVTDAMFLDTARALAGQVTEADLASGAIYPPLSRIRDCSHAVACAVIRRGVTEGHAAPAVLNGLEDTVSRAMWFPRYRPIRYEPPQRHP